MMIDHFDLDDQQRTSTPDSQCCLKTFNRGGKFTQISMKDPKSYFSHKFRLRAGRSATSERFSPRTGSDQISKAVVSRQTGHYD